MKLNDIEALEFVKDNFSDNNAFTELIMDYATTIARMGEDRSLYVMLTDEIEFFMNDVSIKGEYLLALMSMNKQGKANAVLKGHYLVQDHSGKFVHHVPVSFNTTH